MRKFSLFVAASALGLLLTGCSATNAKEMPVTSGESLTDEDSSVDEFSFANIQSCEDIKPFVETWTEGFVPYDWNNVSENAVQCGWSTPHEEVTPENARSVEVNLSKVAERPDYSPLESLDDYEPISDDWVTENGGQAYTITVDTGLSAVIGTTVWVPDVEVTVSGGRWANLPDLDGAAALEVTKLILGPQ